MTLAPCARFRGFDPSRLRRLADMEVQHFWFAGRRVLLGRMLRPAAAGSGVVLDVGCGTGSVVESLEGQGYRSVGIDSLLDGLLRARRGQPGLPLVQGDGLALPVRPASCAGVLLLDVLEHTDDVRLLDEVRRALAPGGWLLLTVPAMPWLWSRRDAEAGHHRRYTRPGLIRLLERAGLTVEDVRFFQCLLFPVVVVSRVLGKRHTRWQDAEEHPPRWLNRILSWTSRIEADWSDHVPWPWGSTLAARCRRPA